MICSQSYMHGLLSIGTVKHGTVSYLAGISVSPAHFLSLAPPTSVIVRVRRLACGPRLSRTCFSVTASQSRCRFGCLRWGFLFRWRRWRRSVDRIGGRHLVAMGGGDQEGFPGLGDLLGVRHGLSGRVDDCQGWHGDVPGTKISVKKTLVIKRELQTGWLPGPSVVGWRLPCMLMPHCSNWNSPLITYYGTDNSWWELVFIDIDQYCHTNFYFGRSHWCVSRWTG